MSVQKHTEPTRETRRERRTDRLGLASAAVRGAFAGAVRALLDWVLDTFCT